LINIGIAVIGELETSGELVFSLGKKPIRKTTL